MAGEDEGGDAKRSKPVSRGEKRARARTSARAYLPTIVTRPAPAVWMRLRERADEVGLSVPNYVMALIMQDTTAPDILSREPDEIRRAIRG